MKQAGRFAVFLAIVLTVWTGMNLYVGSRLLSLPLLANDSAANAVVFAFVVLAVAFPLGRSLGRIPIAVSSRRVRSLALLLDWIGSLWLGQLFLLLIALVAADALCGMLALLASAPPVAAGTIAAREIAVITALALGCVALVQGLREPILRNEALRLPGLRPEREGTVVVQLSDLHLGDVLGARWLGRVVDRVLALEPDLIALTGDILDARPSEIGEVCAELGRLRAPLGVFVVSGNHEFYVGLEACVSGLEQLGFRVLRDRWEEAAPGLIIAGVDDLTARRQIGRREPNPFDAALSGRPAGATVLLCHSPLQVADAAARGVGLMLSGHTHGGQIWPFGLVVGRFYPDAADRRERGGLTLIVSRGTGTWGPRMRLFRRSEILRITLHAGPVPSRSS